MCHQVEERAAESSVMRFISELRDYTSAEFCCARRTVLGSTPWIWEECLVSFTSNKLALHSD